MSELAPIIVETDEPTARSLHRKLAQILYEAERIPKNGTAPQAMGSYRFVQVGDAADFIRKALAEKVLTMMPTNVAVVGQVDRPTKSGGTMTTLDLLVDWTITDGESGESIVIQSFGAGADGGDKYSGKAMTSAMKYAFLAGFLLSTGDDTEQQHAVESVQRTPAEVNAQERERLAASDNTRQVGEAGVDRDGLIGTAIAQGTQDFELRQSPTGYTLPFRVKDGGKSFIVLAEGKLAEAIEVIKPRVVGQRVTVWGRWTDETIPAKGTKPAINYRVLHLERIETPDGILPPAEDTGPEPPDDVPLVGESPALGLVG